uniref:Retrovirus-related Pol polyprotein from type-1 retrotransposable element R1 n=1 Tax=Talaromyces marneffei PM1 TaxID=1077442 RepID=A0A093XKM3_TALMA
MPNTVRWLGVILDRQLSLKSHYSTCLQKARGTEMRLRTLCRANGLTPELPGEQPLDDREWSLSNDKVPKRIGQRLAKHLAQQLTKDPSVFDAELVGVASALEWALERHLPGPIHVLLDAQNAIKRLQSTEPGAGQSLALRPHMTASRLRLSGRPVTIQWVPGHNRVEGNEQADQAAKPTASKPAGPGFEGLSLAYVRRACTEARRAAVENWARENAVQGAHRRGRAYRMPRGWGLDRIAAKAPKRVASRSYQLKTGHAPIGTYLHRIKARDSPECGACGELRETISHIIFECRGRRGPRRILYKGLADAGVPLPIAAEDAPEARLFSEPKATTALLQFVASANLFRDKEQATREAELGDHWGWEALRGWEDTGVG